MMEQSTKPEMHGPLCDAIIRHLKTIDGLDLNLNGDARSFSEMGADSTAMMIVSLEFEEHLETELPPHLLWDCPDVDHFADYLLAHVEHCKLSSLLLR